MTPVFMVNEETLKRTPQEVLTYLRFLRRRIQALEATNSQRRIEELEAANRKLQTEIEDLKGALQQVRQRLAHAQAQLGTNSTNSSLPPSSDRFHCIFQLFHDESCVTFVNHLGYCPTAVRNHRRAAGHRFNHYQSKWLRPVDRQKQSIGIPQEIVLLPFTDLAD